MALVRFEKHDGLLTVALNRPEKLNALNAGLLKALESGLDSYFRDDTIKALMLCGQDGCFAAGADIRELSGFDEAGIRAFHDQRERAFTLLETFPAPTFAVIERYALGTGLELSLCCDFRICGADAQMGLPSAKLGVVESYAYLSRLVRAAGRYRAKKLILTGERIDASTAFAMNLVDEIVPPEAIFERAQTIFKMISNNSAYAMRESKKVVDSCAQDPYLTRINDQAAPMVASLKNKDFIEGTKAFLEKRQAKFS